MIIRIEIDCESGALHEDLEVELSRILDIVPSKVIHQLVRDGRCICEAKESADTLRDLNGNKVGTLELIGMKGRKTE